MVYKQKLVAVVKCQGKILREQKQDDKMAVSLPFGSEYSILLKNLHSQRASIQIWIDGQDVLNGSRLVIGPREDLELKGFLGDNSQAAKAAFKFIQKTQQIADHRGDKIDDGLIVISYAFEQPVEVSYIPWVPYTPYIPYKPCKPWDYTTWYPCYPPTTTWSISGHSSDGNLSPQNTYNLTNNSSCSLDSNPKSNEGVTVPGSEVHQDFQLTAVGIVGSSETIVIALRGQSATGRVEEAVTVQSKTTCPTCGITHKSGIKFCSNCGTNLQF